MWLPPATTALNASGALLWERLAGWTTGGELTAVLAGSFGLTPADAARDVARFLTGCADAGLLEVRAELEPGGRYGPSGASGPASRPGRPSQPGVRGATRGRAASASSVAGSDGSAGQARHLASRASETDAGTAGMATSALQRR